jgi:hypothetical protein
MSTIYLPINQSWLSFQEQYSNERDDSEYLLNKLLEKAANEACEFQNIKEYFL